MEIHDRVRVNAPPEVVWPTFLDVERVAPCLPGAQLDEIDGDEFRGRVKVKVGPIQEQYRGTASFADIDEGRHRLVIAAAGRETRGQGNAAATITVQVAPEGTDSTAEGSGSIVTINTDLTVTGRVAQLGRGVLGDVSAKLLAQFAENVEDLWAGEPASATRRLEPEPVDLVELGGGPVARRLAPLALAGFVLLVVWWVVRHRHAGRT